MKVLIFFKFIPSVNVLDSYFRSCVVTALQFPPPPPFAAELSLVDLAKIREMAARIIRKIVS